MWSDKNKQKILKAFNMNQEKLYIHVWRCVKTNAIFSHEQNPFATNEQEAIVRYSEECSLSNSWIYEHTMAMDQSTGTFKATNIQDTIENIDRINKAQKIENEIYGTCEDQARSYYNSTRGV